MFDAVVAGAVVYPFVLDRARQPLYKDAVVTSSTPNHVDLYIVTLEHLGDFGAGELRCPDRC